VAINGLGMRGTYLPLNVNANIGELSFYFVEGCIEPFLTTCCQNQNEFSYRGVCTTLAIYTRVPAPPPPPMPPKLRTLDLRLPDPPPPEEWYEVMGDFHVLPEEMQLLTGDRLSLFLIYGSAASAGAAFLCDFTLSPIEM
jgi:hypothetical protein